jgi:hypothetical protein
MFVNRTRLSVTFVCSLLPVILCVRKVAVHLQKVLEVMSTASNTESVSQNFLISLRNSLDDVQVFLGIFQQIAPALNRCIYCLLERRIQQENTFPS